MDVVASDYNKPSRDRNQPSERIMGTEADRRTEADRMSEAMALLTSSIDRLRGLRDDLFGTITLDSHCDAAQTPFKQYHCTLDIVKQVPGDLSDIAHTLNILVDEIGNTLINT